MKRQTTVEAYLAASPWKPELTRLRRILRSSELEETVKWGAPVYTAHGKNVVGIGGFKSYFGLWFFQGALLADEKKLLVNAQEGRTKAMRQLRFGSAAEIDAPTIRAYVKEAIELAEQGREITPRRKKPLPLPPELEAALARRKRARKGFDGLTPGKRREYAEYVAEAKQDATKQRRIAKILPLIEAGVGLNDKYRNC
jgi:uncharacterized protein YdeI (YjbR/CyaY-like superfamily)